MAAALAGLVTALFLRKLTIEHRLLMITLGLAVGVGGVLMVLFGTAQVQASFERRDWPSATGVIVESKVVGERAAHSVVIYEFRVDGQTYRDSSNMNQPSFGGRSRRREVAVKTIAMFLPGAEVKVYYNARQPEQSALILSAHWSDYGISGLGAILLAAGVCLVGIGAFSRKKCESD